MQHWNSITKDDGATHAIGNGKFILYGQGPNFFKIAGPSYSSPDYGSAELDGCVAELNAETERLPHTNTWISVVRSAAGTMKMTDAMDPQYNLFKRKITSEIKCRMKMNFHGYVKGYVFENYLCGAQNRTCFVYIIPKGTAYFTGCPYHEENRLFILTEGCVTYLPEEKCFLIEAGEGEITFAAAKTPETDEQMAFAVSGADVFARSEADWRTFLAKGGKVSSKIPAGHPEAGRMQAAFESIAVVIRSQQSFCGGVMAGQYYPMAYVRDQAGTIRGLLKMNYIDEAQAILKFWYHKWQVFGNLHNAETMGNDEARLMFSNDEVEVPAYVVLSAFAYYDATGDEPFLKSISDMLIWAVTVQLPHLGHGMTGFSADETYIAGGFFPRPFIYHGSAESTLLFIESTKRFLKYSAQNNIMPIEVTDRVQRAVNESESLYKENFTKDGILYGNNSEREKYKTPPRFHFGYCDCDIIMNRPSPLTWLERGEHGIYRCPSCLYEKVDMPYDTTKRYQLGSVTLLPPYYQSTLFNKDEIARNAKKYIDVFEQKNLVSSNIESDKSLGYDYGLFLYNMVYLGHPLKEKSLTFMLDHLDSTGAWVEYYDSNKPYNCRYRPWESAINMDALIYYLDNM
ncbi:MAG: hypothetical protein ACYCWE_17080 [Eubacteriales bacterium]